MVGRSEVWQASGRQNSHGSCQLSDRFSDFSTCMLCQHRHPFPWVHVKRVPTSVYEFPAADKDKKGLTAYKLQGSRSWNWRTIMLYYSVWFWDGFWRYPWSRKKKCISKHGEEEMVVEVVSVVGCTSNAFIKFIAGKPAVPQKRGSSLWMGSSQRFISKYLLFLKRQLSTAFQNATWPLGSDRYVLLANPSL